MKTLAALLLTLAAAPVFADPPIPPPPEYNPSLQYMSDIPPINGPRGKKAPSYTVDLPIVVRVTLDGKPVSGAKVRASTCEFMTPFGAPDNLQYRTDAKGLARVGLVFFDHWKTTVLSRVCAHVYSLADTRVFAADDEVSSSKPGATLEVAVKGRLAGYLLGLDVYDKALELEAIQALRGRNHFDRYNAAVTIASVKPPSPAVLPALTEALEMEYYWMRAESGKGIRRELITSLRRFDYDPRRSKVLLLAVKEEKDHELRQMAKTAPKLER